MDIEQKKGGAWWCFVGHRKVENQEVIYQKTKEVVNALITKENVRIFLFGGKSEFDDICHTVVV